MNENKRTIDRKRDRLLTNIRKKWKELQERKEKRKKKKEEKEKKRVLWNIFLIFFALFGIVFKGSDEKGKKKDQTKNDFEKEPKDNEKENTDRIDAEKEKEKPKERKEDTKKAKETKEQEPYKEIPKENNTKLKNDALSLIEKAKEKIKEDINPYDLETINMLIYHLKNALSNNNISDILYFKDKLEEALSHTKILGSKEKPREIKSYEAVDNPPSKEMNGTPPKRIEIRPFFEEEKEEKRRKDSSINTNNLESQLINPEKKETIVINQKQTTRQETVAKQEEKDQKK